MATVKVTKTVKVEEEIEVPLVIAGAIYSFVGKSGETEEAICLATRHKAGSPKRGLFRTFGEAEAWYAEGSECFLHWKLVCEPVRLEVKKPRKKTVKKG